MRRLTTLAMVALLVAVAPGGALAAPAATTTDVSTTNAAVAGAGAPAGSAAQADCSYPVTRTDATGTEVTVSEEPDRVVVLAPSAAQVLWEIDAESKVVGLPTGPTTAYLNGSQNRTDVTNQDGTVNREKVVGLQPDLVLAPNIVPNSTVEQLRSTGLTVYKAGFGKTLDSITTKTALYGRFVDACEGARQVNEEFNSTLADLRANAPEQRPRAYYYFFNFTTGNGTFIHEAIETAGGDNVAANAGVTGFRQVNTEIVAEGNPQVVVRPSGSPLPSGAPWDSTTAYQENRTLTVDANLISQPGPRVVQPMQAMQRAFLNASNATASPTASPTAGGDGSDGSDDGADGSDEDGDGGGGTTAGNGTDTTSGSGPGFGVPAAVVAALAAAALLARRD